MVKTTYIAELVQYRSVKPCANCPMFKRRSLPVLFVIIWARPRQPSKYPTLKPSAAGVGSLPPRAPQGHRFTTHTIIVEATPPRLHYSPRRPTLQPRPASTSAAFGAAPSLAICPPFGCPRRRRLRRPVASKVASLRRRRLRRRGADSNRPNTPRPPQCG